MIRLFPTTRLLSAESASARRSVQTPSPSMALKSQMQRNRPKSFAQKFRPNSRLAGLTAAGSAGGGGGGAAGGGGVGDSPLSEHPHDSFILTSAPLEMISEEQGGDSINSRNFPPKFPQKIHSTKYYKDVD